MVGAVLIEPREFSKPLVPDGRVLLLLGGVNGRKPVLGAERVDPREPSILFVPEGRMLLLLGGENERNPFRVPFCRVFPELRKAELVASWEPWNAPALGFPIEPAGFEPRASNPAFRPPAEIAEI